MKRFLFSLVILTVLAGFVASFYLLQSGIMAPSHTTRSAGGGIFYSPL